ncbi:MAG TPA: hypothetical protein VFD32_03355, partial [Dehalococcoidia bacterium]|nr:hypothetical protein [Dehalococcoidia bacterium]
LIVFLLLGGGGGNKPSPVQIVTQPPATPSPSATVATPTATAAASPTPAGVTATTRGTVTVYTVPDTRAAVVARLPGGLTLPVAGRSDDDQWLLVNFSTAQGAPSTGTGWLQASAVQVGGDLSQAPILSTSETPSPSPSPAPTPSPSPTPTPTPSPTPAPTRSPTQPSGALPDLVLSDFNVLQSGSGAGFVAVNIRNAGPGQLAGQPIELLGVDQTGATVFDLTTGPLTLAAGGTQQIRTSYKPTARTMLTVVINPNHTIPEADAPPGFPDTNNSLTKAVFPPNP